MIPRRATSECRCSRRADSSSAACGSSRSSTERAAAGAWDAHGGLKANHERNFKAVDKPIAGLLKDLKQRGLLDSTIVLFASEFGRTPGSQGADGRDHHIYGFSVWMAGGGIKGGVVHGATDEIGFHAVENRHYVTDIHATILQATRPRLAEARNPGPQASRHRPRQADHRDSWLGCYLDDEALACAAATVSVPEAMTFSIPHLSFSSSRRRTSCSSATETTTSVVPGRSGVPDSRPVAPSIVSHCGPRWS